MFYSLKQSTRLVYFVDFIFLKNQRFVHSIRPYSCFVNYSSLIRLSIVGQYKGLLVSNDLIVSRNKSSGKKKSQRKYQDEESSDEEDEEQDDDDDDSEVGEKGADIKTYKMKSLRVDAVLKAALGISRSKIEKDFYQNKIRVNGELIHKKSQTIKVDDELDLIKGCAPNAPGSIIIGRVKILKIVPDPESGSIAVKAWKSKALKIDNYQDRNAWVDQSGDN